jgi:hypothetical protein
MPLSLIQVVLGMSFALVWVFIGTMILRDGQFAVRGEHDADSTRSASARKSSASPRAQERIGPARQQARRRRSSAA